MSDPANFEGPFDRLVTEMVKMPPMKWEGYDAKAVGWENKPDPEKWAVVEWMAKNIRTELLAYHVFRTMRFSGLIQVADDGSIIAYTLEQKAEITAARRKLAAELRQQRALAKQNAPRKTGGGSPRRRILDLARWLTGYHIKFNEWPTVEQLLKWIATDETGPLKPISRMTLHRYQNAARAAGVVICSRRFRNVVLSPGPKFPAELLPPPPVIADEPAL